MSAIAAIHVARKQLGLDEDTYRAVAVRVTGKSSARDMTEPERQLLLEEFRRRGFTKASSGSRKKLDGRFAAKLQALWIAAWNLGLVENRDDRALVAFVRRQTGVEHVRFLHYPEDAAKAIEALKGWMTREAAVDWSMDKLTPEWARCSGYRIAWAQFTRLPMEPGEIRTRQRDAFVAAVHRISGRTPAQLAAEADWVPVMNAFGEKIRRAKGR
jgi:phage gp16-like protein